MPALICLSFFFVKYFIGQVDRDRWTLPVQSGTTFQLYKSAAVVSGGKKKKKKVYNCSGLTRPVKREKKKRKQAFAPTENRKMHRKARYCGPFRKIDRSYEHFQNDRCIVPVWPVPFSKIEDWNCCLCVRR